MIVHDAFTLEILY